jgi:thioredoxin-disulfide reductase
MEENSKSNLLYDVIIVGAGPAGVAAGIYAVRREMKTLLISRDVGGQINLSGEIENYPGFTSIKNFELVAKFQEHLKSAGVETKVTEIKKIEKKADGNFLLYTNKEAFETKTIILTMGLIPRRLAIPGEERLNGKGVSYCANCDGPLYKGKTVAVIGGGNSALDAAEVMSKIAAKVYLIHRREDFRAFEELVEEVQNRENIEILMNTDLKEIIGENKVERVKVCNSKTGETSEVELNGVFIEIGRIAHTDLVGDLVERDKANQIVVDEKQRTSQPGIYAAGDVTTVEFKQISIAIGQGTIAALAAYQYLLMKQGKKVKNIIDRSSRIMK